MVEPKVKECMEELLEFTLESHIKGTLEIDLALPSDFCSYLFNNPEETSYPLYKQLALSLYESNAFSGTQSQSVDFELHVQEPFFTQMKKGLKTIEGRCNVGQYTRIGSGALILFNNCLVVDVKEVRSYGSFSDMLKTESLEKVLPGVKTIERVFKSTGDSTLKRSKGPMV